MRLSEYIKARHGNAKALAEALGVDKTQISNWARTPPSPANCVAIERTTAGQVTRQDLREDWRDIWPELAANDAARTFADLPEAVRQQAAHGGNS